MLVVLLGAWIARLGVFMIALGVLLAMELAFPRSRPSLESRMRGVVIALLIITPAGILLDQLLTHAIPTIPSLIPNSVWRSHPALSLVGFLIGYDFFFYVMHRIQHRFFWKIHAVHHSIEELSAANFNNHPLQLLFDWSMIFLPLAVLGLGPGLVAVYVLEIQSRWIHSSTRLNFGPLRWVLNDNRHHRIHHSREREHWDKNFSLFFPFWDLVFGTAYMHDPEAWPLTGVHDLPEAKTLLGFGSQSLGLGAPQRESVETRSSG